ncbi:hypothetical protein HYQ46_006332 [Verticillium longisporum]|nr:hypothetical protein HYQ46_006332 [Verticillium longisporum]
MPFSRSIARITLPNRPTRTIRSRSRALRSQRTLAPRVLDIGSGSGYLTHLLAELVGESGTVVGVEHIDELRQLGEGNMAKSEEGRRLLGSGRVKFRTGDGRAGWTADGNEGWDAIHKEDGTVVKEKKFGVSVSSSEQASLAPRL